MRTLILFCCVLFSAITMAQTETFDLTTYTPIKGWSKEKKEQFIQFGKEDEAKGIYCAITLYKSLDASADAKENFEAAWESLVKDVLKINASPEMQEPIKENGWEALSGYAQFEIDGNSGIALLVTATGGNKMVNILVLTNTDVYEPEMTKFLESVNFKNPVSAKTNTQTKKETKIQTKTETKEVAQPQTTASGKYAFHTTNFDDGWTSVEKADWVEVTKGSITVFLHYPKEGTVFPADPEPLTNAAWNILVAPRYSNLKNYRTNYISSYVRGYIATGYATQNATGKEVFIVFFRRNNGWIEGIAPDKNTFIQEFKFDPETINYNSDSDAAGSFDAMTLRNKFAVSAADLNGTGTWTNNFANNTFYANIYTGNSAGMSTYSSGEDFVFLPGQKFKWSLVAANSYGGQTKFASGKSEGNWKMNNNWEIWFSNIEKKPKRYHAYFSCIKGARMLHLLDAEYPGSGIYTVYGKK